jgi:hypothetical protein
VASQKLNAPANRWESFLSGVSAFLEAAAPEVSIRMRFCISISERILNALSWITSIVTSIVLKYMPVSAPDQQNDNRHF